jgi:glycosyltransferase involved in cell wall biosynthesis
MAVVHNTPELGIFAGARLGSARPPKVFAYHGSMSAQRGLDILIRGFSLAAASHPGIRLELAGSGESYPDLVELALNAKVSDRIRFTGSYRFEELTGLYSEADIGMITYPIDESVDHTIGNKLFDYMACGKPVIVSPAIPLKRIVEGTQVGIVIDQCSPEGIKQGIEKMLISDIEPYSRNGIAASQERYNWNHDSEVLNSFIQGYL